MLLEVGDVVYLTERSPFQKQADGHDGVVIDLLEIEEYEKSYPFEKQYRYRVRWDNGHSNTYRPFDVELSVAPDIKDFM